MVGYSEYYNQAQTVDDEATPYSVVHSISKVSNLLMSQPYTCSVIISEVSWRAHSMSME